MVVVRIVFWTWLAFSLCVFAYRGLRWATRGRRRLATSRVGVAPASTEHASTRRPAPARPDAGDPAPRPASAPAPVRPTSPDPAPATASSTGRSPAAAPSEPPSAPPAPTPPGPSGTAGADGGTLAELLAGIRMPCDLVPLPDAAARPGSRESVAFATTDHRAEEVGAALAAELERLGFRVHPLGGDELLATRGDGELKAAVHRRAGQVAVAGQPAFPTARPEAVAVQLWRD